MSITDGLQYRFAFYALIQDDEDRYLVLQRSPDSSCFSEQWEMPGGKPNMGETAVQTLQREVEEETGIQISVVGLAGCTEFSLPAFRVVMLVFRCIAAGREFTLSEEHVAADWVDEEDILEKGLTEQARRFLESYFACKGQSVEAVCVSVPLE